MKGNATVIKNLQAAASLEAACALCCHLCTRTLKSIGVKYLKDGCDEWGEACECYQKKLVDRLLFFGVAPKLNVGPVECPMEVTGILQQALTMMSDMVAEYQGFCKQAWDVLDDNTRNLFEHLIKWHEGHIDDIERELNLVAKLGEPDYIAARLEDE